MRPLDSRVPALLLRLDRNPFHHGALGVVRSLGRAGVEVHAFVEPGGAPLARSRYLAASHHFAGDPTAPEDVAAALRAAARRIGRPAVLVPLDDVGALAVARLAPELRESFLLPDVPPAVVEQAADKVRLAALCGRLGIPHPRTVVPESPAAAVAAVTALGLPVVAKWSRPWLLPPGSGLRSTTVVSTAAEARRLYEQSPYAGSRLILQRMLRGGPRADWFFHGCFAADGTCLLGGTGRKELSWPRAAGLTAVGSWVPNRAVTDVALRLAARVGFRGVLDLDFRRDPDTGSYHLLDFNPRPGAQFRLFEDRSGLDVVRALHLELTGRRPVPPAPARPAGGRRTFVVESYGLLASLSGLPGRRAAGRGGGRGEVEWAWFAADDPAPFLAATGAWARRLVRWPERAPAVRERGSSEARNPSAGRSRALPHVGDQPGTSRDEQREMTPDA
ncbi:ATP-grasp domain-containing protein [Streptomyces avicenniae]|uniref:carboxylate--amine ligase n=1 Tax=Streptomyces avicenniae TaxID=500153 RepID=UPI000B01F8A7|nr:ATP-grasp domain-containing protein [Streptomyces avicenniae]